MRNPYSVLGVEKSASASDIKKAYRKLAKTLHPDHNTSDPKAKDKFTEVNAAYELLHNPEKRRQFDAGEIDAAGNPLFRYGAAQDKFWRERQTDPGGFSGFWSGKSGPFTESGKSSYYRSFKNSDPSDNDIFSQFFGGFKETEVPRRTSKSKDIEVSLPLTLEQIASEKKHPLTLPGGRKVEVTIPRHLKDGQTIRLRGLAPLQGAMESGDVLLKIKILPHATFRVENSDIRFVLPLNLDDAVLGTTVRIPTLRGDVDLTIPPMTDSGKTFRLRSRGLPTDKGYGDQYVTTQIKLPAQEEPELTEYVKHLREKRQKNKLDQ